MVLLRFSRGLLLNRHGYSKHFRGIDNTGFHILSVTSDCSTHVDAYCYKKFRCNQKFRCGLLPPSVDLFFMRSRFSNWKSFLQPRYRDSYRDGSYTLPWLPWFRVVWPAKMIIWWLWICHWKYHALRKAWPGIAIRRINGSGRCALRSVRMIHFDGIRIQGDCR